MISVTHLRVLAVDDDAFALDLVQAAFGAIGVRDVLTEESGQSALELLDRGTEIDVLVLDLNMPEMDGIAFLRHLAQRTFRGAVVFLSAEDPRLLNTALAIAESHRLRVLGAVEKPVRTARLTEMLTRLEQRAAPVGRPASRVEVTVDELRLALANHEIIPYYQPKVSLTDRSLVGAEALARWRHPEKGMIPPNAFVPLAEEHDLIDELTLAMYRATTRDLRRWVDQGRRLKVAVNLSTGSLRQERLPELLGGIASSVGVDPRDMVLEVTESRLMRDLAVALEVVTRLRLKGFGLSIDDFGTGYSSMEQLRAIPFNELKIDRGFVTGAAKDPAARAIVESSVSLAKKLHMSVVAEGVETWAEWSMMRGFGCDLAQGYLIARPVPADELWSANATWSALPVPE